jgi:hypothetical protein
VREPQRDQNIEHQVIFLEKDWDFEQLEQLTA